MDLTAVSMYALMPNLDASMDLMADVIKNPAFDPQELERIRATQLTRIAAENTQPMSVAMRTLPPLLFGKEHHYGVPFQGTGDPADVQKLTRNALASFHHRWIRDDNAEIFAVGNTSLSELKPLLEKSFGLWRMTRDKKGRKNFDVPTPDEQQRIILVNRDRKSTRLNSRHSCATGMASSAGNK